MDVIKEIVLINKMIGLFLTKKVFTDYPLFKLDLIIFSTTSKIS